MLRKKTPFDYDTHPLSDETESHEVFIMLDHFNGKITVCTEISHDWTWRDERLMEQWNKFCDASYALTQVKDETTMDEISDITEALFNVRSFLIEAGMKTV